jgi:hypothetical protein
MHRDSHLVQPGKGACTDAANDNRIDLLIIKRLHWIAGAMRVVLVPIVDRRNAARVRIENNKYWR